MRNTSMEKITVSISDMKFANRTRHVLVTHSLGSCLGVTAYDPVTQIGAMIHCLLPDGMLIPGKCKTNPFMFVNTGVPEMVRRMISKNVKRDNIIMKAAGCAHMMNIVNKFDTGQKNWDMLEHILRKNNFRLAASDVGGTIPRTMRLYIETGTVEVCSLRKVWTI